MQLKKWLCVAVLGLAAGAMAQDKNSTLIDGKDPQALLSIAKGHGSAELTTDSVGDPLITGRISGNKYQIYFYDCEEGENCETISFVAAWDTDGSVDLDAINSWNANKRFGRAYIDSEDDATLDWDVVLRQGVSTKNFDEVMEVWAQVMGEFADHIEY